MNKDDHNISSLYESYLFDKVKQRGIIVPILILLTVLLFTLVDYLVLALPSFPYRLLAIIPLCISIIAFSFKYSAKTIARIQDMWIWGGNLMMAGLAYLVFKEHGADLVLKYGTLLGYSIAIYISILVVYKSYAILWAIISPLFLASIGIYLFVGEDEWVLLLNLYTVVAVSFFIIHQQHKQEFSLFKSRLHIQDLNKQLDEFAYMISHDLKSPIRSASLQTEVLRRRLEKDDIEESKNRIANIQSTLIRTDQLLDDILNYSRSMLPKELETEWIDINQLIIKLTSDLSDLINSSHANIQFPKENLLIMGNYTRLYQVFQNLIVNAIKYKYPSRNPNISIDSFQEGNEWILAVHDNGVGVPSYMYERIFNPFERYHTDTEGSGLGLAMVKRHIKFHTGSVSMESEENVGSSFFLHFPLSIISPSNPVLYENSFS